MTDSTSAPRPVSQAQKHRNRGWWGADCLCFPTKRFGNVIMALPWKYRTWGDPPDRRGRPGDGQGRAGGDVARQLAGVMAPGRLAVLLREPCSRRRTCGCGCWWARTPWTGRSDGVFTTDLLDPRRYLYRRRDRPDRPDVAAWPGGLRRLRRRAWRRPGRWRWPPGTRRSGRSPTTWSLACRRHRLPLFEVPVDVSFAAITEQVLTARLRLAGPAGPGPAVARLRSLAAAPAGAGPPGPGEPAAASLSAVFAVADSEYGTAGWVISAAGRLIAGAPPAARRGAAAPSWPGPGWVRATGRSPCWPAARRTRSGRSRASRRTRWPGGSWPWPATRAAGTTASGRSRPSWRALAAGYRARHEEGQRAARQSADNALRRVLDWRAGTGGDEEIAAALRRGGLAPCPPLVAVALTAGPGRPAGGRAPDLTELPQVARVLLEEMLPAPVVAVSGAEAIALAPGGAEVVVRIREAVDGLARVPWAELAFGVSVLARRCRGARPAGRRRRPGRAPRREQRKRRGGGPRDRLDGRRGSPRGRAGRAGRGGWPPCSGECAWSTPPGSARSGCCSLLLPEEARGAFRAACLTRCWTYDAEHGTELVRTLEVFLAARDRGPRRPRRCSCTSTRSGTGSAGSRS